MKKGRCFGWQGNKARSIGTGLKRHYLDTLDMKTNGVSLIREEEYVKYVIGVKRVSDRVMIVKLKIEG